MRPEELKIFSLEDSPRLRYIVGIILGDILGIKWEIVTDRRKLGKSQVINYSHKEIPGALHFHPASLLFENDLSAKDIEVESWKGLPVFFKVSGGDLPFDIFAASFYLVTRYEEYLPFDADKHGRFPSSLSVAFKNRFLDKPIVDLWTMEFAKSLLKKFPYLAFRKNQYESLLTIDSDEPFANQGKNLLKSIGDIFSTKTETRKNGKSTGKLKDPYDVYDYIIQTIERNNIRSKFFFPVGDRSKFDLNPSWKNDEYRNLIRKIGGTFETGLHPSYTAGGKGPEILVTEASRLKAILNRDGNICRFHYLRLSMPGSYMNCIGAGFSEDHSMGYPDEPGFRAGIARPYYFYNLLKDVCTNLKIIPFQVMDATLFEYKKLNAEEAKRQIENIINDTRKVGGLFVSIWHNTSLLDNEQGREWREVFEYMIKAQL